MRQRDTVVNVSGNEAFRDVVARRGLSRRRILGGGLATAAVFVAGGSPAAHALAGTRVQASDPLLPADPGTPMAAPPITNQLGFTPIAPSTADAVVVPPGYTATPFLPWGTPLFRDAPAWDINNDAAAQERQVGMNHDGMWFFPFFGDDDGIICINHEYTNDEFLFPDGVDGWDAAKTAKSQAAHGVTVARIRKEGGTWQLVFARVNRRITANSAMELTGPAAGHRLLRTAFDRSGRKVDGTVNNCGMGHTPWGTYLTCEENFHGYFKDLQQGQYDDKALAGFERYGIDQEGAGYLWADTDERWRADLHPNQPNKFGWVVEIDPRRPDVPPRKRTALGRLKHEGAWAVTAADGRVVVYMGDDERGEYVYKFVSAAPWERMLEGNQHPLDHGTLYVARFNDDGTGEWLPLVHGNGPLTGANGFADQGEVLIRTRAAADLLEATKMDRPEWGSVDPVTGHVYMTMTNNSERGSDEQPVNRANPRAENEWGHIVRWMDHPDHTGTTFHWDILLLAGPGNGVDGSTINTDAAFGSPDGLWMDGDRRLWIQTDGGQPAGNDQMLAADPVTRDVRRFLVGVPDCEITGITATPDQTTMWINVQHPGDHDPAVSHWPEGGSARPRSASVIITKDDGGTIGS